MISGSACPVSACGGRRLAWSQGVGLVLWGVITAVHVWGVLTILPISELATPDPILNDDYSTHFYRAKIARQLWEERGCLTGYNPSLMAGYPAGTLLSLDNRALELVVSFAPVAPIRAGKLFLFILLCLPPIVVYAASRQFCMSRTQAAAAAGLAVLSWWIDPQTHRNMVMGGMYAFLGVSFLSIPLISMFWKYTLRPSWRGMIWLAAVGSCLVSMHMFSPVILCVPMCTAYFINLPGKRVWPHVGLVAITGAIAFVSMFWLLPVCQDFGSFDFAATEGFFRNTHGSLPLSLWLTPIRSARLTAGTEVLIGLLAAYGLWTWWRQRRTDVLLVFLLSGSFYFLLSFYGSWWGPTSKLQPMRFLTTFQFVMALPAGVGACSAARAVMDIQANREALATLLVLSLLAMPRFLEPVLFVLRTDWHSATQRYRTFYRPQDAHFLKTTLPPQATRLLSILRQSTNSGGRILVEDSCFESGHRYFGAHGVVLAYYLDRQYLMGDHGYIPLMHNRMTLRAGHILGRELQSYSPTELCEYLSLYNVHWVLGYSEALAEYASRYPEVLRLEVEQDGFQLYNVRSPGSFLLMGQGEVELDCNGVRVTGCGRGPIVLKYHWTEGLRCPQGLKLSRFPVSGDPVGFIRVDNDQSSSFIIHWE